MKWVSSSTHATGQKRQIQYDDERMDKQHGGMAYKKRYHHLDHNDKQTDGQTTRQIWTKMKKPRQRNRYISQGRSRRRRYRRMDISKLELVLPMTYLNIHIILLVYAHAFLLVWDTSFTE